MMLSSHSFKNRNLEEEDKQSNKSTSHLEHNNLFQPSSLSFASNLTKSAFNIPTAFTHFTPSTSTVSIDSVSGHKHGLLPSTERRQSPRLQSRYLPASITQEHHTIIQNSISEPQRWWTDFLLKKKSFLGSEEQHAELNKATELFSVDEHRKDPALLSIWLAFIEAHWLINQDIDETRKMFKFIKGSKLATVSVDLFLTWAQWELEQGSVERAKAVIKAGLEYEIHKANPRLQQALGRLSSQTNPSVLSPVRQQSRTLQTAVTSTPTTIEGNQDDIVASKIVKRTHLGGPPKRVTIEEPLPRSPSRHRVSHDMTIDEDMSMTRIAATGVASITTPAHSNVPETGSEIKSKSVRVNGRQYKVLQLIGRGGSSRVFRVTDQEGEVWALKKVGLKNLDETTLAGYLNEIELLKNFADESSIIHLMDSELNQARSCLYMIMEYGEADLSRLLREQSERDENFIRYMWQQMLLAVKTVHAAKIVHCDLKPANFLLVRGKLKLIDFGISKTIQNDTTNIVRENQVGTLNYMSPEALKESSSSGSSSCSSQQIHPTAKIKIGRASDVWSLGCILYEMVYGAPPFARFSLIQRLKCITDESHIIDYDPGVKVSPALLSVIKGCLTRSTKERLALEQLLAHPFLRPIQIPPDHVLVRKEWIEAVVNKFASKLPMGASIDVNHMAHAIYSEWQEMGNKIGEQ